MVVILCHILGGLYLQFRRRIWSGRDASGRGSERRSSGSAVTGINMGIPVQVQDAVLLLSGIANIDDFEDCAVKAILRALSSVADAVIYAQQEPGGDLTTHRGLCHALPKSSLAWEAVKQKRKQNGIKLPDSDPLAGLLYNSQSPEKTSVMCCPVLTQDKSNVVAVLVLSCAKELSQEDGNILEFLLQQLAVCHQRVCQVTSNSTNHVQNHIHNVSDAAILHLCAELYDQDATSLQLKVIKYLQRHTDAQSGFLLLRPLGNKDLLGQVFGEQVLEDERHFRMDGTCFGKAVNTKQPTWLHDMGKTEQQELEAVLGYKLKSFLCVPINILGDVVGLACMANKCDAQMFNDHDVEVIQHCFKYTAAVLRSTLAVQNERRLKHETQALLQVTKNLFTHLDDLTVLLREIMQEARNLTNAERCSVFLLDAKTGDMVAKVFDGDVPLLPDSMSTTDEEGQREVRISLNQGIAGHVATTGQLINIDDAYSHPLFFRGMDEATGFRTRNILCFPIKNENDQILGVAQLCNKLSGPGFTMFDEEIAMAFSVYCCIAISHSLMYKRVHDSKIRSKLSNELMIYHMRVPPEDVQVLNEEDIPPPQHFNPNMDRICFTPRSVGYDDTPLAVFSMLEDMNFLSTFRVHKESFSKFLLMVRKGYRDPPYHNWSHAFSVAHFCYIMYKNANLSNYLADIEIFALFIACLCHDIDHRGTNNSYQVQSGSVLASLYSSEGSVMERHHFAQSMCILNTEGCNIFENLSSAEYHVVLDLMRDIILATDLAHHLRIMPDLEKMVAEGYMNDNQEHKMLLICMLMTCCDLSDQTKNWANTKKIAELIYREFFSQGDLEKALGRRPLEMMDREKAHIPQLQIDFLDSIVLPLFRLLGNIFPDVEEILSAVEENKRMWVRVNTKTQKMRRIGGSSLEIFEMDLEGDLPS